MAYDKKKVKVCRCPECFAKEIDMPLRYDEKVEEYYCVKCCYTGTFDQIEEYFSLYKERKYRDMLKIHPYQEKLNSEK